MFKVWQIVSLFAVLWISLAVSEDCLYTTKTWGDDDPTHFFYCDPITNQSESVDCADNRGYVNNATTVGCIPWDDWSDECVSKTDISNVTCEGDYLIHPIAVSDPKVFYLCIEAGAAPVVISCPEGKGFYAQNKYLGCYSWEMWRNVTGCVNA